jgi:hypothetical protein
MKLETNIDYFLIFIIFIKIVFGLSAIGHVILSHSSMLVSQEYDDKFVYWKERTEFIFIVSMAILLIYHFNPRTSQKISIDRETSILFYLFGWILIITAKWSDFITGAKWYQQIVNKYFV